MGNFPATVNTIAVALFCQRIGLLRSVLPRELLKFPE
jgi:hypothetical protein